MRTPSGRCVSLCRVQRAQRAARKRPTAGPGSLRLFWRRPRGHRGNHLHRSAASGAPPCGLGAQHCPRTKAPMAPEPQTPELRISPRGYVKLVTAASGRGRPWAGPPGPPGPPTPLPQLGPLRTFLTMSGRAVSGRPCSGSPAAPPQRTSRARPRPSLQTNFICPRTPTTPLLTRCPGTDRVECVCPRRALHHQRERTETARAKNSQKLSL